jgi:hypothetical protein
MSKGRVAGGTRLYHVTGQHGESRIVDAASKPAAIAHVNKDYWVASPLTTAEALRLGAEGVTPERAEAKTKSARANALPNHELPLQEPV